MFNPTQKLHHNRETALQQRNYVSYMAINDIQIIRRGKKSFLFVKKRTPA